MIGFIRRHPLTTYFALAFAISWGGILAVVTPGPIPAPPADAQRLFVWVYLAMLAGPPVAGITMTLITDGIAGLGEFWSRLVRWRVGLPWYVIALLTAPLAMTAAIAVMSAFSPQFLPAFMTADNVDAAGPLRAGGPAALFVMAFAVGIGAGIFEEIGWSGFAVPRMLARSSRFATGLTVGVLWGGWHFLAVLWGSADAFGDAPVPLYLLVSLFASLVPFRVLMVNVYSRTSSLLIAILMHASLTSSSIILGPSLKGYALLASSVATAGVLWALVAVSHRTPPSTASLSMATK